jgi:glycosyltransferase involved in cell wall biosynthesis
MKVVFVAPQLASGGAERQWSILLPGLSRLGFEVSLCTLTGEGRFFQELRSQGIEVRCLEMRNRFDRGGFTRALEFAQPGPDIVVSWSVSANVVASFIAARGGAVHIVAEHSGCDERGRSRPLKRHQRALMRVVSRRADAAVAVATAQINATTKLGFRPTNVHVVPNGVPEQMSTQTRAAVREDLGLVPSDFVAISVANLRPEKRIEDFSSAVREAHRVFPRVRGLIVGDGRERDLALAHAAADPRALTFVGHRDDVPNLLAASDVVCLASVVEGMPVILLEAMAAGRPVIATRTGGNDEVVVEGVTGWLVPPRDPMALADRLVQLASSPHLGAEMAQAARAR